MKLKITFFLFSLFTVYGLEAQCDGAQFEEKNGIVVIEAESGSIGSSWRRETSHSGYTGNGYITWRGSQYFSSPGNAIIQYKVKINSPGKYRFMWRNRISILASHNANTEHNDTWLKIPDASNFYGEKPGSRVYPGGSGKTPVAAGATSGGWFKLYTNVINWNWDSYTSDHNGHFVYAEFNSPGVYTIQLSARSSGHSIDRMVLFKESQYSLSAARNLSRAETRCDGTSPPPSGGNQNPTVSITSPSNGQNFNTGANVTVNLSASDSDGSITKHEIFVNGTRVDNDGSTYSPYVISNIAAGNYTIRARVTDDDGATAESSVSITAGDGTSPPPSGGNQNPTVSITSPNDGQNFTAGSNVTVNLSASDSDGSIAKHEIFVNGSKVDTDGSSYSPYVINNIASGSYTIKARVTDNDGATAESSVSITAGDSTTPPPSGGNQAPTVSITSPNDGQNFTAGSNVTVNLSASDSDGSIVRHEIFVNGTKVDTDGSSYTAHVIRNIANGSYTIMARVTDNEGATGESTVGISVGDSTPPPPPSGGNQAPTVTITSPNDGQNFTAGSNVTVNLSASDSDGSIVRHEIFVNGTKVDTDGSSYTAHVIRNIANGSYTIMARVTDNEGATGESTVGISVGDSTPPPPPSGSSISLTVVDGNTDQDIQSLDNGVTLSSGSGINVRANSSYSGTASIFFNLQGPIGRSWTENNAPYALFGDVGGNYNAANLPNGSYSLSVSAYSGQNRSGSLLGTRSVSFSVGSSSSSSGKSPAYVYPNPVVSGKFSVRASDEIKGKVDYMLINTAGSVIESGELEVINKGDTLEFDMDTFSSRNSGIYYLILQSETGKYNIPLIKQ